MPTPAEFLEATKWGAIATLILAALTALAFVLGWGFRYRLVGVTGFMAVLVVGFFGLSFEPLTHSSIPGAIPYTTVYDSGAAQVVIKVPDSITEEALRATLRQAASNLFKASRLGGQPGQIPTIRARVLAHDSEGASRLVYLGQVQAVPNQETGEPLTIHVNRQALGQLSTQSDS